MGTLNFSGAILDCDATKQLLLATHKRTYPALAFETLSAGSLAKLHQQTGVGESTQ